MGALATLGEKLLTAKITKKTSLRSPRDRIDAYLEHEAVCGALEAGLPVFGTRRSRALLFLVRRAEKYGLSDLQATDAGDRAVDARGVLVHPNDSL